MRRGARAEPIALWASVRCRHAHAQTPLRGQGCARDRARAEGIQQGLWSFRASPSHGGDRRRKDVPGCPVRQRFQGDQCGCGGARACCFDDIFWIAAQGEDGGIVRRGFFRHPQGYLIARRTHFAATLAGRSSTRSSRRSRRAVARGRATPRLGFKARWCALAGLRVRSTSMRFRVRGGQVCELVRAIPGWWAAVTLFFYLSPVRERSTPGVTRRRVRGALAVQSARIEPHPDPPPQREGAGRVRSLNQPSAPLAACHRVG